MVLSGRSTLSTLRDLMVLMSFPLLLPLHTSHIYKHTKKTHMHKHTGSEGSGERVMLGPLDSKMAVGGHSLMVFVSELTQSE